MSKAGDGAGISEGRHDPNGVRCTGGGVPGSLPGFPLL